MALIWVARAGREAELTPEVHLYLADLHYRFAFEFEAAGKKKLARRHRVIADQHAVAGPPPDLPPAVAMAMAVPRPPIMTDARGQWFEPPDGAA